MYRGHDVQEITRSDADAINLSYTTAELNKIIEYSKANNRKSICFVTGVPGAGKTLVGLNLAIQYAGAHDGEHAVFLSGNLPLVEVLQEALARDEVERSKQQSGRISKKAALRKTSAFIQIIHKYRDSFVGNNNVPPEKIVIFDEAQRAWTKDTIKKFMQIKKNVSDFRYSEPEFLISTMDRHEGWAVIVCLVGGGQEINTGEAGLPEWFNALRHVFSNWDVYVTPELDDKEYRRDAKWEQMIDGLRIIEKPHLHLASSVRSFRTPYLAAFINAFLDINEAKAKNLYQRIKDKYPIIVTRDLEVAKKWVKEHSPGTTRYGLLASSGALRLKPEGIFVKNKIGVSNWFLNGKNDIRASYALEDVATEFDIQGLEIDYSIVAWDADLRLSNSAWSYNKFKGSKWTRVKSREHSLYLKNAYRVILTRARQGMAIFVPKGDSADATRNPEYYDELFEYFKKIGITIL